MIMARLATFGRLFPWMLIVEWCRIISLANGTHTARIVFVEDLAKRLNLERVQVSSDALRAYVDAIERGFGSEVDYGQIVKTYTSVDLGEQRRYSPPEIFNVKRTIISGNP